MIDYKLLPYLCIAFTNETKIRALGSMFFGDIYNASQFQALKLIWVHLVLDIHVEPKQRVAGEEYIRKTKIVRYTNIRDMLKQKM